MSWGTPRDLTDRGEIQAMIFLIAIIVVGAIGVGVIFGTHHSKKHSAEHRNAAPAQQALRLRPSGDGLAGAGARVDDYEPFGLGIGHGNCSCGLGTKIAN